MRLAIFAGLALAGCSQVPEAGNDILVNGTEERAMLPDAAEQGMVEATNGTAAAPARYVGRWAANAQLCKGGAWKFAELDLSTAGEVSCDFRRVRTVAGGYDADATCLAEGAKSDETIRLRFGAEKDRMRVESKTFQAIELMRCVP